MAIIFFYTQYEIGSICHIVSFPFHFKNNVLKKWIIVGKWYYVWLLMLTALLKKCASWNLTKEVKIHTLAPALLCSARNGYDEENRGDFCFLLCMVTFKAHRWGLCGSWISHWETSLFFLFITQLQASIHIIMKIWALGYERRGNSWCLIVVTNCRFWKPILKSLWGEMVGMLQGYTYSSLIFFSWGTAAYCTRHGGFWN